MIDLRTTLNPSQQRVVETTEGAMLVIAGAGSGKTRVIEYRVLNLVAHDVKPSSILLLTFTRRAARQMLARAAQHDRRCQKVEGGTFHSFAYAVLKDHIRLLGFDSFLVLDEDDAQEAVGICVKRLALAEAQSNQKRFPKKDTIRKIISAAINKELSIAEVLEKEYPDLADYERQITQIRAEYSRYKRQNQYFDYDDLLVFLRQLLQEQPQITKQLSQQYRYIMVDEYQDTNKLQADILYQLSSAHRNIMVVGDDAQSIYGFRGANHQNILDFPRRFAPCAVIKLENNYRSRQAILDVANAVLEDMRHKFSKRLIAASDGPADKPALYLFGDIHAEAEWIARSVLDGRSRGTRLSQQAVLFRSSYISIPLQAQLSKMGIAFQVFGGMKFYETAHVKDVLAHLKIVANARDEISWLRSLMLIEGVGPRTARTIFEALAKQKASRAGFEEFFGVLAQQYKQARKTARLGLLLDKLAHGMHAKPSKQFAEVLQYYRPIMKERFDDWQQRLADLETLRDVSVRYDSLVDFLADFALDPPERQPGARNQDPADSADALVLSTIHSAKGLEWEQVFVIGLCEGVLPSVFALNDDDALEEEKRLLYVAITRAKRELSLCVHHEGTGFARVQYNRISRFIDQPGVLATLSQKALMRPLGEDSLNVYQYE